MKISINREDESQEVNKVIVHLNNDVDLIISQDKFGELVVTKVQHGEGESTIVVKPNVSNVIQVS